MSWYRWLGYWSVSWPKKAFDTVDHNILIKKLYTYGIRGVILKWFDSYLNNKTHYTTYNGMQSETHTITCGVPQGSTWGPVLFIKYINDICDVSGYCFKFWWYMCYSKWQKPQWSFRMS